MNDQYTGKVDPWDAYLTAIEKTEPAVSALGITDYFTLRAYKKAVEHQALGRLQGVFLFANVELRLMPRTHKDHALNLHLLLSPNDPRHIALFEEAMSRLTFRSGAEVYPCTEQGIFRLGEARLNSQETKGTTINDATKPSSRMIFEEGAKQFKIEYGELLKMFETNPWLRENCFIAIPGGDDGGRGLVKSNDSYEATADGLYKMSHFIFSSSDKDRSYWLGKGALKPEELQKIFDGKKPCIHGSDAHDFDRILKPDDERRCWIKAKPEWEGLKQALHEPEDRVFIGSDHPQKVGGNNSISSITVDGASWFPKETLTINNGLVAIIGSKGAGKTALADLLAYGCGAYDGGQASFIRKASELIEGATVTIQWTDGRDPSTATLGQPIDEFSFPEVKYLSQQFVEALCSPEGKKDTLVEEIEKVIFDRLEPHQRLDASSFSELRDIETTDIQSTVAEISAKIQEQTQIIVAQTAAKQSLSVKQGRLRQMEEEIIRLQKEKTALASVKDEKKLKAFELVSKEYDEARRRMTILTQTIRATQTLQAEIQKAETWRNEANHKHSSLLSDLGFTLSEADLFMMDFRGDYQPPLREKLASFILEKDWEEGRTTTPPTSRTCKPFSVCKTAQEAAQKELDVSHQKQLRFAELSKQLTQKNEDVEKLKKEIDKISNEADNLAATAQKERSALYGHAFEKIKEEEEILKRLYQPLQDTLKQPEDSTDQVLEFSVKRSVDLDSWVERGEALLDLRKNNPLTDEGALLRAARTLLLDAWEKGDSAMLEEKMKEFVREKLGGDWRSMLVPSATPVDFATWLFSLEHIKTTYDIRYGGLEIEKLTPGTRGIVLLMLYLAIDQEDTSPLIVDQPEENLDPQSIFQELVQYFRTARQRRQIILVTHNANLVVNADADQVIVASSSRETGQKLPIFSYGAGPLEDEKIRKKVCQILEGGEQAFRNRERRYNLAGLRSS